MGADPARVRVLAVSDGDVLLLGIPAAQMSNEPAVAAYVEIAKEVREAIRGYGRDVAVLAVPADMTVRHVRTLALTGKQP